MKQWHSKCKGYGKFVECREWKHNNWNDDETTVTVATTSIIITITTTITTTMHNLACIFVSFIHNLSWENTKTSPIIRKVELLENPT